MSDHHTLHGCGLQRWQLQPKQAAGQGLSLVRCLSNRRQFTFSSVRRSAFVFRLNVSGPPERLFSFSSSPVRRSALFSVSTFPVRRSALFSVSTFPVRRSAFVFRLIVTGPSERLCLPSHRHRSAGALCFPSHRHRSAGAPCFPSNHLRCVGMFRLSVPHLPADCFGECCKSAGILARIDDYGVKSCKNTVFFSDSPISGLNAPKKLYYCSNFHVLVIFRPEKLHFCSIVHL
ncbi:hypothetical protein IJ21_41170 [Paenibacillus sp. 32O-W]|nr:hypothetical protein IJ21_41170 [Paenibacillus sp. 32O-W]